MYIVERQHVGLSTLWQPNFHSGGLLPCMSFILLRLWGSVSCLRMVLQLFVFLDSNTCIKSTNVKKFSKQVPVIVEVGFSKSPNNIITETFSLKQLTLCLILAQINLESRNIVYVCFCEKPNFYAKLIKVYGHILLEGKPPFKFDNTLFSNDIFSECAPQKNLVPTK